MDPTFDDGNSLFDFVVLEGNGVKGLVDSGLAEVPKCYIQPPKERIDKRKAGLFEHPAIDMSQLEGPNHDRVVEEIARAAETLGFFQVANHGVPLELLEALEEAAHKFFGQPPEKKTVYLQGLSPSPYVKYGTSFVPEKEKALEWKDYISMVYTTDVDALAYWPPECKEVALEYLKTSSKLVKNLLKALIGKLGVAADESRIEALIGHRVVNMNFYPTCPKPELTVGVGRHSDIGTLTVLLQDGIGGLYVKLEGDLDARKKGEWIEIPPVPGALVINIGDALQVLSNGRYKSAEHTAMTTTSKSRVSVPLFTSPKPKEKIGPLPEVVESDGVAHYREVVFEEYMKNFFGNVHDGKKSLDFATIN